MNSKLFYSGIVLMAAGAVGIIFAVAMEIVTNEPVYLVLMKITAGLFGVGGPLLGFSIAKKKGGRKRGGKKDR